MKKTLLTNFLFTLFFCLIATSLWAENFRFSAQNSNQWNDLKNWKVNGVDASSLPGENDDVVIDVSKFSKDISKIELQGKVSIQSILIVNDSEKRIELTGKGTLSLSQSFVATDLFKISIQKLIFTGSNFNFDPKNANVFCDIDVNSSSFVFSSALSMQDSTLVQFYDADVNFGNLSHRFYDVSFEKVNLKDAGTTAQFLWVERHFEESRSRGNDDDLPLIFDKSLKDGPITCGTPPNEFDIETVVTTDYNGSDISCNGANDAQVCVNVTGGSGSFSFQWITGPATQCWSGIDAGNYSVIVTDLVSGVNCGLSINVTEPSQITTINVVTTDASCNGVCDGTITHVPFGGTGTLSFFWSPDAQTAQNPTNVCAGPNDLTITDDNGCTFNTTITVNEPSPITINSIATNVQCNGDCDGTIDANASGGTGNLSYQWYDCGTGTPIGGETNQVISGLCPGTYYVEVTDDNGCVVDNSGTCDAITEPPVLGGALSNINDASCPGVCDGTATFTPSGGTAPYTIEWFDVPTNTSQGTGSPINTLCGGQDYYAVVTDDNGCTFTSPTFTIDNNTLLTVTASATDVSCFGDCDGTLSSTVSNGTAPYSFDWTTVPGGVPAGNTQNVNGVCPGDYQIVVTDDNGCTSTPETATVNEPAQIAVTFTPTDNTCFQSCDGSVQAVPAGGVGPYTYVWTPAPPTGQGTDLAEDLCAGNWEVEVTDDNGCSVIDDVDVNEPPQYDITINSTNVTCNSDCDGTAGVTVNNGGSGAYTYTWTPVPPSGQGVPNATNLCAGTWELLIQDGNGCDSLIEFNITEPNVLNGNISNITNASCSGVCNGSATFTPNGGTGPYTVEWFDVPTNTSQGTGTTISNLCGVEDYYAVVTDDNGCTFTSPNFTINNDPIFNAVASATDVSCFGDCDGTATANVTSGGTAPFSFQWTTVPGGAVVGGSANLNGLCPGTYEVLITDDNGCNSPPIQVVVNEPAEITVALNAVDNTCFQSCDGSVQATPNGGTAPYTYNWTPAPPTGQGTDLAEDLCAGNWEVEVTDDNGCTVIDDVDIVEPAEYDITISSTDVTCNAACNGSAGVNVNAGGTGPYTYTWNPVPPSGQGNPTATGLCAGVWELTIADQNGCDSLITFNISEPTALVVNASVISNPSCNGDCNGSAEVNISGGNPAYIISWNDPSSQSTVTASGLCAGNYTVNVVDQNGCTGNDNITITEPAPFDLTVTSTDVDCNGNCNGSATVTVNSGGTPNYFISWNDPLNQNTFTANGLCAGTYEGTITDQNGCDSIVEVTINEPPAIVVTVDSNDPTCFAQCTGEITISIAGGAAPYNIEWFDAGNNPLGVNNTTISNLCAGDYYAEITDQNGCVVTTPFETIIELPQITTTSTVNNDATCNLCDGSATVTAAGGAGGFTFNWNPAPGAGQGTQTASNMCPGVYTITITDANGCSENESVTIGSAATENITMNSTDVTCNGGCDGTATASFVCFDPACSVEWFDASTGASIGQTTQTATNLCAGDYTVVLTNGSGCTTSEDVTINEPPVINVNSSITNVSCNGICDGEIDLTVTGGFGPYTFTWSPLPGSGQGTNNVTNLCAGSWDVQIEDATGCIINNTFNITEPTLVDVANVSSSDITCFGDNDGSVSVIPSGGTAPYTYEWFDCVGGGLIGNTQQVNNLGPGSYQVVVTDATGCSSTSVCVDVVEPGQLTGVINVQNVTCSGDCNGLLDVVPNGGINNFNIQWLDDTQTPIPGETNDTLNNVCAGTYYVTIEDLNGCQVQLGPQDVLEPTPWDVTTSQNDVLCNGNCTGSASVTVLGGNTPPYSYSWDDPLSQNTATATALCAGNYQVILSDINGCDTAINFTLTESPEIIANGSVTDVSCFGDCDGDASINPTGGVLPYNFNWSTGDVGTNISNQCAGSYDVTISDANGCIKDTTLVINEPTEITASVVSNNSSCGNCNGSAIITPSGGAGGYIYVWSPAPGAGQGTNNGTSMCAGIYNVTITDASGCSTVIGVTISDINGTVPLNMSGVDASCFGTCDGEATVTYICNDPPCTQEWFDATGTPIGQTGLTATNLCAGDYDVVVTNGLGCVTTNSITINEPTQIDDNETITDITCNGAADGEISVVPSGGSGVGYSLVWTPVPGSGQGSNPATGLNAGTWDLEITDGNGCTENFSYTFNDPPILDATFTSIDATCAGDCNGSITVIPNGGVPPYTYQWLNNGVPMPGETSDVVQNLCSGNYNVEVTDATGCVFTFALPITISSPNAITAPISNTGILCNGDCDGTATVIVSGGVGPYNIVWYNGSNNLIGQTGPTASNLCAGDYYAIITDANGCIFNSNTTTISEPNALTFTINSNDASCFGQCDGDASITVNGGNAPYSYTWTDNGGAGIPGGSNPAVSNLCAGTYFVEVIDANGCIIGPESVVINENAELDVVTASNDATCGSNNGSATANPNGGTPPYSFQWFDGSMTALPGETNNTLLNVGAGTYFVTVTDAAGCQTTEQVNINNPNTTNVVFDNVTDASCFGQCDGSIEITATPVNPPLTFVWNPGGIAAEDPVGLCAGNYTLQVTDALGCINFYDTIIQENPQIDGTFTTVDATCGDCNGEAVVTATGGTGVYTYDWTTGGNTDTESNLCAGAYDVQVTDDDGCSETISVNISNTGGPTGEDIVVSGVTCNGDCDGTATVTPIGGTPPYTYNWIHNGATSNSLTGLCAGTYTIEMIDANGCKRLADVTIGGPSPLDAVANIIPPDCGSNNGQIIVTASGGTAPYTYSWNSLPNGDVQNNVAEGNYILTLTDAAGCSENFTINVSGSTAPQVVATGTDPNCNQSCDGSITTNVTGGTPGYTYTWLDNTGAPIAGETNSDYLNVCEGDYTVQVEDAAGCLVFDNVTLTSPDTLELSLPDIDNVLCGGDCNGVITSIATGGTLPYSYSWDDPANQTTVAANGLCAGIYTVTITDANGCSVDQQSTVSEPTPISFAIDSTSNALCVNTPDGNIYVSVAGGSQPYIFNWTSDDPTFSANTEDLIGVEPGNYYLELTDDNGCTYLDTAFLGTAFPITAIAGPDTTLCYGLPFTWQGTAMGGNGPIDYTWFDGNGEVVSDTTILSVLPPSGTNVYILYVEDSICSHTDTMIVTVGQEIIVDAGPDQEVLEGLNTVIGGNPTISGNASYSWSPADFLSSTTETNPDVLQIDQNMTYYITATDTNGCEFMDSVNVIILPEVIFPNGFSPNGDGTNDNWIITLSTDFPDIEVEVYNRWGDQLFYSRGYDIPWDGNYKGKPVPVGTYYYIIKLNHPYYPEPYTGPLTIMR